MACLECCSLLLLYLPISWASTFIYEQRLPVWVRECFDKAKREPVDYEEAELACILSYYNQESEPRVLTDADVTFFQRRQDQRFGHFPPKSGFRTRREVRTLSEEEWERFVTVVQTMYKEGTLHRFGRLHGQCGKKVHKGAAFLPWHRVFILDFEEEMRRIDQRVFLPYWDYTIDNNITRPSDSVLWSECFFGNGVGAIQTGPFRNMYGGHSIQLIRDFARDGQCPPKLINKMDMYGILKKCHFKDITTGSASLFSNVHNLELLHDGVHDWLGGDLDELPFSAFDPVFYLHHAFIDYIWEKFRQHQISRCNVDPERDWRPDDDLCQKGREDHRADDTFFGYSHLRNIDGSWQNWTRVFYNYEDQPTCPDCGHSKYLYCDKNVDPRFPGGLCLTKTVEACEQKDRYYLNLLSLNFDDGPPVYPVNSSPVGRIKGLPGDGRSRNMSLENSKEILLAETARGGVEAVDFLQALNVVVSEKIPYTVENKDKHPLQARQSSVGCLTCPVPFLTFIVAIVLELIFFH